MSLLLLGGTADARRLAKRLSGQGIDLVYSIAGRVRQPELDCPVVSGGFSAQGGLARFVETRGIDAILDVTHPYAETMSTTAVRAAKSCGIPLWRYQRPAWQPEPADDWREFANWLDLPDQLVGYRSVFFTCGQLPDSLIERLETGGGQSQLLRTALRPAHALPQSMTWIEDIGPFERDAERELFQQHSIDLLVSKNSGGESTSAKLAVARELGVPVLMLRRPQLPVIEHEFDRLDECAAFVLSRLSESV